MKILTLKLIACIGIVLSVIACKKETSPTRDTIKPKAQITITGGGFSKTFYSDSTYNGQLNMKKNTLYTVIVTGIDTGGIKLLDLALSDDLTFGTFTGIPAHTETNSGINKYYTISTSATNPYVSVLLSGGFTTYNTGSGIDEGIEIQVTARDWGNNTCNIYIPGLVTAQPPNGLYGWMPY